MFAARGADEARITSALLAELENGYKSDWGERADTGLAGLHRRARARPNANCGRGLRPIRRLPPRSAIRGRISPRSTMCSAACSIAIARSNTMPAAIPGCSRMRARWSVRPRSAASRTDSAFQATPTPISSRLSRDLFSQEPIEPALEEITLAFWLSKTREFLTADDPLVKLLLGRESPEGLAHRLVSGTRLGDAAERRRLYEGGADAIARSDDPLILFVRQFDKRGARARQAIPRNRARAEGCSARADRPGALPARRRHDLSGRHRHACG